MKSKEEDHVRQASPVLSFFSNNIRPKKSLMLFRHLYQMQNLHTGTPRVYILKTNGKMRVQEPHDSTMTCDEE